MFYKKNPSISKIKLSHSYFIKRCDCFYICIVFTFIILIDVLSHFCLIGFPIFFDDKKAAAECSYIFLDLAAKFFPFFVRIENYSVNQTNPILSDSNFTAKCMRSCETCLIQTYAIYSSRDRFSKSILLVFRS